MRNCWHHDDFLFESQFPATEPAKNPTAGNELLERFLRRFCQTCGPPPRRPEPQQHVVGSIAETDISPMVIRSFPVSIERTSGNFPVMLNGLVFRSNSLKT
jgi:hypothetical protein